RAGSLSNAGVRERLNRFFVPVYISNEDYTPEGAATSTEKAALRRIFAEGYAAHLSVGTVHAYVLDPNGHTIDSMHVALACKPSNLIPMLDRDVARLHTVGGPAPPESAYAPARPHAGTLKIVARYLEKQGEVFKLADQSANSSGWSALPSVETIELPRANIRSLLPPAGARPGACWDVGHSLASLLLIHFYPPTEDWDLSANRISLETLRATYLGSRSGTVELRLSGRFTMKHPFYHKDDDRYIQATVLGYAQIHRRTCKLQRFDMVTVNADYLGSGADLPFGAAVSLVGTVPHR
ncbi:MAG TPA: hypothetical protein VGS41_10385, partial [Chthonomonadales bacterium]|nr:hypothetical protein [Chthonomonadales bacterium]